MRKQLVIGVSLLTLTGLGGVRANSVQEQSQEAVSTYVHFVRTCQNQTFEPLSGASLAIGLPNRANYQTAGVHFIVSDQGTDFGNDDAKNNDFSDPTGETCKNLGYTVTSCETGLFNQACPYNDKIYDRCCDVTYKYTSSQCSSPKKLSSDSCGGKYRCYCDTKTYPYASCNDPQIKGSSCTDDSGTRYATCVCPNSNNGQWGCKEYYASPCNSICKTPYTDCCHLKTSVATPYGCEKYFDCCSSKCEKAYTDNCRNRTAVIASCPANANCTYFADCKSKVQSWSCKSGFVKSGNSCINPCDLRTAVISSCPANATCSYFSDCKSKIQSWSCNSGYNKSGNSCVQAIKSRACQYVGDILYGDGTCAISVNELEPKLTPIGVVFDVANRLAIALTDVKKNGSAGAESMYWSSYQCDTPNLENCMYGINVITCGTDGRANTDAILASTCDGTTYAANAVNSYQVSGCSKDFCRQGKWFLPSMRDLNTIYSFKSAINSTLTLLSSVGASQLTKNWYWSSTESNNGNAWLLRMSDGIRNIVNKNYNYGYYYVRPVLAF